MIKKTVPFLVLGAAFFTSMPQKAAALDPYAEGEKRAEAGDYDGALKIFKNLINSPNFADPQKQLVLRAMAKTYGHKHEYSQAINTVNQALLITKKTELTSLRDSYWTRGSLYSEAGKPELAIKEYTEILNNITLIPHARIDLLKDRSAAYEHTHQFDKSIEDLTAAIKSSESLLGSTRLPAEQIRAQGLITELLYKRAHVYDRWGKPDEAKRDRAKADKLSDSL